MTKMNLKQICTWSGIIINGITLSWLTEGMAQFIIAAVLISIGTSLFSWGDK